MLFLFPSSFTLFNIEYMNVWWLYLIDLNVIYVLSINLFRIQLVVAQFIAIRFGLIIVLFCILCVNYWSLIVLRFKIWISQFNSKSYCALLCFNPFVIVIVSSTNPISQIVFKHAFAKNSINFVKRYSHPSSVYYILPYRPKLASVIWLLY